MATDREFSWRRCTAWTAAIGLHALVLVPMSVPLRVDADRTIVASAPPSREEWELHVPVALAAPIEEPMPRGNAAQAPAAARTRSERRRTEPAKRINTIHAADDPGSAAAEAVATQRSAPIARPLVFLDDEARARLPHEPLYSATSPAREGDFHTPGDGSEDDVLHRPLALDPETTRFEKVWQPSGTLGGEVYGKLVRATTAKVRVPLNPKFSLVCGASIAGLGGGCLIVRDGGTGIIVDRPPPAPWERANRVQCRELRDELAAADDADDVAILLDRLTALCTGHDADAGRVP